MTDYALIITHNRPDYLRRTVQAIAPQVDLVVIVDNASDPPAEVTWDAGNFMLVADDRQPVNIAALWNTHLDVITAGEHGAEQWNVAVLCDDAPPGPGWFNLVSTRMRARDAAMASTHSYIPVMDEYLLTRHSNGTDRACPWAFVLPGEKRLRADETMHWHYCDTDLDNQARRTGGSLVVPGPVVPNLVVGGFTDHDPVMQAQAERDKQTFIAKWGFA